MKTIFFLGGHDLEMLTIKEVLAEYNQEFLDKDLGWDNATLDKYEKELKEYTEKGYIIYGIELRQNSIDLPENYVSIDHHNQNENAPSSLEQICELLGKKMDRRLSLVAANDKAYIPGMEALNATEMEIESIRKCDRAAQGVTKDDEAAAESAIKTMKVIRGLTIIKSLSKKYSPIVDRLYPRWTKHLLVYSECEFTYYGAEKESLLDIVKEAFPSIANLIFFGGGAEGYFGAGPIDKDILDSIIKTIAKKKEQQYYSGHIFLFPFSWEVTANGKFRLGCAKTKQNALADIVFKPNEFWERTPLPKIMGEIDDDLYNELNFFHPFTYDTIYDMEGTSSNIWHFERKELQSEASCAEFIIRVKSRETILDAEYILELKSVNINLYGTGVGLLSFYTRNTRYKSEDDILKINQFGRRLFPPFRGDIINYRVTPKSIEILGLKKSYYHSFTRKSALNPNSPMSIIKDMIFESFVNITDIHPVLDDRMFTMSWYKDKSRNISRQEDYKALLEGDNNDFLYQYVFIDTDGASCQNDDMRAQLLKDALYPRWQKWGTLYGISRYSFVMLTTPGCPDYLIKYFETEYVRMIELVLIQRASILHFSSHLKTGNDNEFSQYYQKYIDFLNRFRFPEASAQDQAIELYDMLCKIMKIQEQADYLDKLFNEREEYLELQNQGRLNILAALAVPISIVSAVFGFFFRDSLSAMDSHDISCYFWKSSWPGWIAIVLVLILTLWAYYLIRRRQK